MPKQDQITLEERVEALEGRMSKIQKSARWEKISFYGDVALMIILTINLIADFLIR